MNDCYNITNPNCEIYKNYNDNCYQVNKCFNDYINAGPIKVSIYIRTIDLININSSTIITVTTQCTPGYGDCINSTQESYNNCTNKGVPVNNNVSTCVECDDYSSLVLSVIEIIVNYSHGIINNSIKYKINQWIH